MKMNYKVLIVVIILLIILSVTYYNVIINNQVKVVEQTIKVKKLPSEFEGFTILQITDLHNKSFGKNQEELIKIINSLDFDMIAICGDMQNRQEEDYTAFLNLLKGIENNKNIFYTPGNHGPYAYEGDIGFNSIIGDNKENYNGYNVNRENQLTEAGKELEALGVKFLDEVYPIKKGNKTLWISELWDLDRLKKFTNNVYKEEDINVAVTHYPMNKEFYEGDNGKGFSQYDLVLAGHYHGGQWKIPGFGAIFIPDVNGNGFLPDKQQVSGLTTWGGVNQYVSEGLGAGGPIKALRFRFFNQPEVNLLKLKCGT